MNFKKMTFLCMQRLTNFPYIEEDFDALTNYELLCKVVEYLNKVIANENNQNDAIKELAEAFTNLKNYVDSYFDNLDVQEEVNNKIDEMVENGTFQNLIDEYTNIVTTFSKIGFLHGEENASYNTTILTSLLNRDYLPTIYVDGTYYINNSSEIILDKSLRLIGNNGILIFTNTEPLFKLDTNSEVYLENITFNETSGEFYLFNANNQYTKKLNNIIINNCTFNNVSILRADLLEEYSTSILSYGFDKIIIENSTFNDNKLIPVILQNVPCELTLTNNKVKNMYTRFCVFGITNDNENGDSFRKVMNLKCNFNTMKNDDDFYSNVSSQYHTFIFTKCGDIECIGNNIENIAIDEEYFTNNEPVETFGMYLLCNNLKFSDNTFKNIYNFSYLNSQNNTKIEVMSLFPNIKGYSGGIKELNNNTFILEETWLTEKATHFNKTIESLKSIPVILLFNNDMNVKISNNIVNSYFGYWSYKSYSYSFKNFIMEDNIYNIKNHTAHVNSDICAAKESDNIIIKNNKFNIT
ncbi:MAG: hypothetical protein IIZ67_02800, partial [Bacilli bacterium]|nr:hypothetical protein [Bacilli bacterium]